MTDWKRWFMEYPQVVRSLIVAGFLIRLPFLPLIGFEQDFLFFTSWASYLAENSPITIYDNPEQLSVGFINYPPLYLYILTGLSRFYRLIFSGPLETRIFLCLIKLVTILFEIIIGLILYRIGVLLKDERTGIIAFVLFYLNPALFYISVYYGQVDAIFSAFLLVSVYFLLLNYHFAAGCFLACALLTKIQSIPFIPLLFFFPLVTQKLKKPAVMTGGFLAAGLIILSPYILFGRLDELFQNSVAGSIQWGKYVTVGAFNTWYLHADPNTLDFRIWGWLFGDDGTLQANFFVQFLTYKNLGVVLFGVAFLWTLYELWKRSSLDGLLLAAAHVSLAFYMLPTKVHERYLFPFFIFYAALAGGHVIRRMFFIFFSLTYLINVIVICPLFGDIQPVEEIDSSLGVAVAACNVLMYIMFLIYEYVSRMYPERIFSIAWKTVFVTGLCLCAVLFLRHRERIPNPSVLYLSELTPISFQQDWPPNEGEDPKKVIGHDLSVDPFDQRELRIKDTIYRYGLGTHANAVIEYEIPGMYNLFECYLGVDHETMPLFEQFPNRGTVFFEIYVNDVKRYRSPLTIPTIPPRKVVLPLPKIEGTNRLKLVVLDAGMNFSDHADWALARVIETF